MAAVGLPAALGFGGAFHGAKRPGGGRSVRKVLGSAQRSRRGQRTEVQVVVRKPRRPSGPPGGFAFPGDKWILLLSSTEETRLTRSHLTLRSPGEKNFIHVGASRQLRGSWLGPPVIVPFPYLWRYLFISGHFSLAGLGSFHRSVFLPLEPLHTCFSIFSLA